MENLQINDNQPTLDELETKVNALGLVLLTLIADLNKKGLIDSVHKDYLKLLNDTTIS